MKKKTKSIISSLLVAVVLATGIYFFFQSRITTSSETESSNISESIVQILQLSTLEYNYTDVVSYKESTKYKDFNIPFTEKRFMIKYTGYIRAGYDLSKVEIDIPDSKTIHITIDHASITDNVINEEDVYVYDEKGSIFNNLKIADVYDILVEEKSNTKEKLLETGFLEEADEKARELITELMKAMGYENVVVRFN